MDQIKKFFLLRAEHFLPCYLVLLKDILIILFSFTAAYTLRYNFQIPNDMLEAMNRQMLFVGIVAGLTYWLLGLNKSIIRHTGLRDVLTIVKANFIITSLMLILNIGISIQLVPYFEHIPHSVIIIFFTLSTVIVNLLRFTVRLFYYWLRAGGQIRRVLIYGAGSAGIITKNALHSDLSNLTKVVGFIDNNPGKIGKTIEGIYVYSTGVLNARFIRDNGVQEVILAIHNIDNERRREIVEEILHETSLQVKEVPPVDRWINGQLSANQISPVKISELLQRSEIKLKNDHVSAQIEGKRVMVTGAAGSIGSELVRQLIKFKPGKLIMVDQGETPMFHLENELSERYARNQSPDVKGVMQGLEFMIASITDNILMERVFDEHRPEIIYHAAAYKHVPMMERNPIEAIKVNILGTKNIADLAAKYHAEKFVMISTDKAVNPTNVMGASKRAAEIYIQSLNNQLHQYPGPHVLPVTEFITTRFGNVLGSNGSVIPVFEKQIRAGGPITVTHPEITRYFMTIPEACQLVLEAGTLGKGGQILMFDMGKPVKIADLAFNMIRLSGLEPGKDIKIVYTGLRPGEKLFEELLYDQEHTQKTHHPKIFISQTIAYPYNEVSSVMEELLEIASNPIDIMTMIAKLKQFIPEFISNNSVFTQLDKRA